MLLGVGNRLLVGASPRGVKDRDHDPHVVEVQIGEPLNVKNKPAISLPGTSKVDLPDMNARWPRERCHQQGLERRPTPFPRAHLCQSDTLYRDLVDREDVAERPAGPNDGEVAVEQEERSGRGLNHGQCQAQRRAFRMSVCWGGHGRPLRGWRLAGRKPSEV